MKTPFVVALLLFAYFVRGAEVPSVTVETLNALVRQYEQAELPTLPKDATFVIIPSSFPTNTKVAGFLCNSPITPDEAGTFFIGLEKVVLRRDETGGGRISPLDASAPLPPDLDKGYFFRYRPYPTWSLPAVAVQCYRRGEERRAIELLECEVAREIPILAESPSGSGRLVSSGNGWYDPMANLIAAEPAQAGDLRATLAASAWNYWMNFATQAGSDRKIAMAHLSGLIDTQPSLATATRHAYLKSLRLTLIPGKSAPGSADALIDALTEYIGNRLGTGLNDAPAKETAYERLQLMGFAAVPTLIEHLNDPRLTRSVDGGDMGMPYVPESIGNIVYGLLFDRARPNLDFNWMARRAGVPVDDKPVRAWWEKAQAQGEEDYVRRHVYPTQTDTRAMTSDACLRIVAEHYPQYLREIYERMLKERPDIDSSGVWYVMHEQEERAREVKSSP